jgi:hypothetical protein
MTVDFDAVQCRSVFDLVGASGVSVELRGPVSTAAGDIEMAEVADVLYLPHLLEPGQSLSLIGGTFVPLESVLDCWSVGFFQRTRQNTPAAQRPYAGIIAPDRFAGGAACVLGNLFSRNFGHWTEELLKVAVLESGRVDCVYVIPTLPSFALEFLRLLGIADDRVAVVDRPTLLPRAVFTTAVSHETVTAHPRALVELRERVRVALAGVPSRHGTRLWLEREAMVRNGGGTANRNDVYECVKDYGFEVMDMGALPVAEQLGAVHGARTIAGPHGSQFVHAQFMAPISTVIECFSPLHVNPSIIQICRVLKHSYHQIVGRNTVVSPYARGRDCEVDCEHLRLILETLAD